MTLTGLVFKSGKDVELFNPSVRIEQGSNPSEVLNDARLFSAGNAVFCPHCYRRTGQKQVVKFRNAEKRRVHFYHPAIEGKSSECSNWSGESEKHLAAKDAVFYWLQNTEKVAILSIQKEFRLQSEGTTTRQPDIHCLFENGATMAIEIQVSPISPSELAARSLDLKSHGISVVRWFLYGRNFNEENRRWCEDNNVQCYHLWFDGDEAKPRWKESDRVERKLETSSLPSEDRSADPGSCGKLDRRPDSQPNRHSFRRSELIEEQRRYLEEAHDRDYRRKQEIRDRERQQQDRLDKALYEWFLAANNLPTPPFKLDRATTVTGDLFYAHLRREVENSLEFLNGRACLPSPRHRTGVLGSIVSRLKSIALLQLQSLR